MEITKAKDLFTINVSRKELDSLKRVVELGQKTLCLDIVNECADNDIVKDFVAQANTQLE